MSKTRIRFLNGTPMKSLLAFLKAYEKIFCVKNRNAKITHSGNYFCESKHWNLAISYITWLPKEKSLCFADDSKVLKGNHTFRWKNKLENFIASDGFCRDLNFPMSWVKRNCIVKCEQQILHLQINVKRKFKSVAFLGRCRRCF